MLAKLLKPIKHDEHAVPHGFRSTLKDWCHESAITARRWSSKRSATRSSPASNVPIGVAICSTGAGSDDRLGELLQWRRSEQRGHRSVNFDPAQVYRWLKDHIAAGVCFVTMNGLYDWGWLRTDGGVLMPPSNRLEEVGALAAMVDENQPASYSLDAICRRQGLPGKETALLEEASARQPASRSARTARSSLTSGTCRQMSSVPTPKSMPYAHRCNSAGRAGSIPGR